MWLLFSFVSATIVGIRDFFKKKVLTGSDILLVLCLVTLFSAFLFLPFILMSRCTDGLNGSFFYVPEGTLPLHLCSLVKCLLLIACWLCSYDGIKHLPLTVSGIIAAFGPVETVLAAMLIYGESLNGLQWTGVLISTGSLMAVCWNGKDASSGVVCDRHFWMMLLSTLFSAAAALWDKFAMGRPEDGGLGLSVMFVQCWYNIYQALLLILLLFYIYRDKTREAREKMRWTWLGGVFMVSLCEVAADLLYDAALQLPGCLVSIMAMIRRGSVIVSFLLGAVVLREPHIRKRILDLVLVLAGMLLLYWGSR